MSRWIAFVGGPLVLACATAGALVNVLIAQLVGMDMSRPERIAGVGTVVGLVVGHLLVADRGEPDA